MHFEAVLHYHFTIILFEEVQWESSRSYNNRSEPIIQSSLVHPSLFAPPRQIDLWVLEGGFHHSHR